MEKKFHISEVLVKLRPSSSWSMSGDNYEDIVWLDQEIECPTKEEIETELASLQAAHDALKYQRDRAAAYPSITDQLDIIYHQGIEAWKEKINEIKLKYPKP